LDLIVCYIRNCEESIITPVIPKRNKQKSNIPVYDRAKVSFVPKELSMMPSKKASSSKRKVFSPLPPMMVSISSNEN